MEVNYMKVRIILLRKKHIYYFLTGLAALVILIVVFLMSRHTSATISFTADNPTLKRADFTGDGVEDILYIKSEKDKYMVQVNTKDQSLILEPNKKLATLGQFSSEWPMRLTLVDIARDRAPEIFTQASDNNKAVQHIFVWDHTRFSDALCSSDPFLGFISDPNTSASKILTGNLEKGTIVLKNYLMIGNRLEKFDYKFKDNYAGKDTISSLIKYIESYPQGEEKRPSEIFDPNINSKELAPLGKLAENNCTYKFLDALFMDTLKDAKGELAEIQWNLGFKGVSHADPSQVTHHSLKVTLRPCLEQNNVYAYKINTITLE